MVQFLFFFIETSYLELVLTVKINIVNYILDTLIVKNRKLKNTKIQIQRQNKIQIIKPDFLKKETTYEITIFDWMQKIERELKEILREMRRLRKNWC